MTLELTRHRFTTADYHRMGEVWLVDVAGESITVYRDPTPAGFSSIRTAQRGESLTIQAFPGREVAVIDILG
jgi:Uma2 family endonuclease